MTCTAWTFPIPADRVNAFRGLLTELNEKHLDGLGMPPAFGEPLLARDAATVSVSTKEELS